MTPIEFDDVRVGAYMATDVEVARPDDRVADVVETLAGATNDGGLPVCDGERTVLGYVGASDLLAVSDDAPVETVMRRELVVVGPETSVTDAAHAILRSGQQFLPVVNDAGELLGTFSNGDAVRSQIQRTTRSKVERTREMLEQTHATAVGVTERNVAVSSLIPTQQEVFADELEGRTYELKNGLAEPLIVVDYGPETVLVDGHHRALAALRLNVERVDAYALSISPDEVGELGLRRSARLGGLDSLADVAVNDYV
ncbi:CBS domain-containing protein [Halogeometricum borinquense]|uniref:CBS domain-containing protein n=1 Tax=Halogeometricum borinquense TaxID=60847 RepID=A0A6C0UHY0_9EURY|nr:CBS domain-containing protein [Halogeometricum borinquense]QIB75035.1 CBS domain-containing protein [Halogeometricum borinquense]QIQ75984.1 CBS domain-containing protein [Halogeometricum borinquense]